MDWFSFIIGTVVGAANLWYLQGRDNPNKLGGGSLRINITSPKNGADTIMPKGTQFQVMFETFKEEVIADGTSRDVPLAHVQNSNKLVEPPDEIRESLDLPPKS